MRYLVPYIQKDLNRKMVFVGGPRQCGKTTMAKEILDQNRVGLYLNWDDDDDRNAILKKKWSTTDRLLIFDELHKFRRWKTWIKGLFDKVGKLHQILVTGSARLDLYRRGGDSLMGRYHYWRLHPFTLCERPPGITLEDGFDRLMRLGGFPEPFLQNDDREARRWRRERLEKVIKDDLRDLEAIRDVSGIMMLLDLLRERVSGPIVVSNLAENLQVASKTVKHWIDLLERMYVIFTVKPYTGKLSRALSKPVKIYFYDNADVIGDNGPKFENLVATHLLKRLQFLEDRDGFRYELAYVRDKEKHEVDFVVLKERKVEQLIEVKWNDETCSSGIKYFNAKLKPSQKSLQLVRTLKRRYQSHEIDIEPALDWLAAFVYS
jgi:predicted AAA+ superfamily ATPase